MRDHWHYVHRGKAGSGGIGNDAACRLPPAD
jgi:hypothetical protein